MYEQSSKRYNSDMMEDAEKWIPRTILSLTNTRVTSTRRVCQPAQEIRQIPDNELENVRVRLGISEAPVQTIGRLGYPKAESTLENIQSFKDRRKRAKENSLIQ